MDSPLPGASTGPWLHSSFSSAVDALWCDDSEIDSPSMNSRSGLEAWLIRAIGNVLSRRGGSASLLVMIYHRVLGAHDPLLPGEPDAQSFNAQMELISSNFNVLPLAEAVARLRLGTLPSRAICVTFDDGYANNYEVALPILSARGIPATVFVAPGFLNGGIMFNDAIIEVMRRVSGELDLRDEGLSRFELSDVTSRIRAATEVIMRMKYDRPEARLRRALSIAARVGVTLPTDLMMTDAQVHTMYRTGIDVGAHTTCHPILTSVEPEVALQEIRNSKKRLEEIVDGPIRGFAYPNGKPEQDYDRSHVAMARDAGFEFALSTAWGAATSKSDVFQIPRIAPWDSSPRRYAARLVRAYNQRTYRTV